MELVIVKAVAALVLPPGINVVLAVLALILWRPARLLAVLVAALSVASLLVFSTPRFADALYQGLETAGPRIPGTPVAADVGALVVLGGGRSSNAWEYGGETVAPATLVRLRYGAALQRETGLPLLVSGGSVFGDGAAEADLMRGVLEDELQVPVRWIERRSRTTAENARYSAELLGGEGVSAILLVTHAMHMPRAQEVFQEQGLRVEPAPTGYLSGGRGGAGWLQWLPSASALEKSQTALHEYLGRLWYAIRY